MQKNNTTLVPDLSAKCKIIILLEDDTGGNLDDFGYSDDLLVTCTTHEALIS